MKYLVCCFIILFSFQNAIFAQESAEVIMENAKVKAKKENKNVLIIFHASWCGWCKKMDDNMNDPVCKDLFDKSFVTEHLVVMEPDKKSHLENPGAEDMFKQYTGGKQTGIPFFLIFNSDGKLIEDSFDSNKQNLGCPASKKEVAEFIKILKNTTSLNDEELAVISKKFTLK
ncbi:thioredoxin family protein [Flavivirga spongiicola]|uniref:Thioredoxin family protein n=1 Tax=Flavivirga spongiicola TaxID=421621 RepID=A0ABU7XXN5_9FLAO|nr:thioredoxin family protein [Flavivirga sp. MEBiC05379]MDO5980527.1 thioredoxin family protein [Flavivirga sp. MEBiC05379]